MKKLTKLLALILAVVMLLPSAALADDEGAGSKELWMQWLTWEEDPEPEGEPHPETPNTVPKEEYHMAFYTSENDGKTLTPIPVDKLEGSKGLTIHPLCPGVKGKENYAVLFVDEWNKEYTISYNGCSMTLDSRLPDLALYSGPEATPDNFLPGWQGLGYSPVRENRSAYIISTAQDETHGRHLVELALAKDCPDRDSFKLEKVSDNVYKWTVTGSIDTSELHLRVDTTWQNVKFMGGETFTESYEFYACEQASLLVGEKSAPKFDRDAPTLYSAVKDEYTNKLTLKAGESKDIYVAFMYFNGDHDAWIMSNTSSSFITASDSNLKVTADSTDMTKATISCDIPGTYTFTIDTSYPAIDAIYHENGEQYTKAEMEKWEEETLYSSRLENGKLMIITDREKGTTVPFDEMFPGQKVEFHMVLDDVWYPVTVTVVPDKPPFPDVAENAWYALAVSYVSSKGYMNGDPAGLFQPKGQITGGEFAQILYNKEGRPAAAAGAFFQGVTQQWYAPAVLWAAGEGIITDTGDAAVEPEKPLTRQQIALMLYNAEGKPEAAADLSGFADASQISGWARTAMEWAVSAKVLQGSGGQLNPTGTATRAEVAQILLNYFG